LNAARKPNRRYLLYRAYCGVALVAWNVVGFYGFVHDQDPRLIVPLIPVVVPAIFLAFNLMAFKFSFVTAFMTALRTAV
jgi:hypothetical protein